MKLITAKKILINYLPFILTGVFLLLLIFFLNDNLKIFFIVAIILLFIINGLSYYLPEAIIVLVALSPFINWQIYLPFNLNAPPADYLGLLIFLAFIWKIIRTRPKQIAEYFKKLYFPQIGWFALFLIIAVFSASQSYNWQESFKYLARPIIFSYLIYLFLPVNLIKKHHHFIKLIKVYFWVSFTVALLSLLQSIYFFNLSQLPRITPFFFGNFAPLGVNQNLLAELLVTAIPLGGILLKLTPHNLKVKKLLWFGIIFMVIISILTLSRTAWLAMILLLILVIGLFYLETKKDFNLKMKLKKHYSKLTLPFCLIILGLIGIAIPFFKTETVALSNANRLMQWQAGLDTSSLKPLWGSGPGSFMGVLSSDRFFMREFGNSLDAHGWPLKILTEEGILGLITFIVFLIAFLYDKVKFFISRKNRTHKIIIAYAFMAAVVAIFFQLFTTSYFTPKMWLPLGILAVTQKIYRNNKFKKN